MLGKASPVNTLTLLHLVDAATLVTAVLAAAITAKVTS